MWVVREGERMWIKGDGDEEEEEKGDDVVHNISLPLQGLLLLLSLFYEMCEKKITFSCTRSFIGAPMERFTQFSQSPFRFPGRFREKRARGSVCCALLPGWMSIEFLTQHKRESMLSAAKGQEKMLRGPKEFSILFFLLVYFFSFFALDYSTHRPPNGIHTHTDELYSERPATEMQPSAL